MTGEQWQGVVGLIVLVGMFVWFIAVIRRKGRGR